MSIYKSIKENHKMLYIDLLIYVFSNHRTQALRTKYQYFRSLWFYSGTYFQLLIRYTKQNLIHVEYERTQKLRWGKEIFSSSIRLKKLKTYSSLTFDKGTQNSYFLLKLRRMDFSRVVTSQMMSFYVEINECTILL